MNTEKYTKSGVTIGWNWSKQEVSLDRQTGHIYGDPKRGYRVQLNGDGSIQFSLSLGTCKEINEEWLTESLNKIIMKKREVLLKELERLGTKQRK